MRRMRSKNSLQPDTTVIIKLKQRFQQKSVCYLCRLNIPLRQTPFSRSQPPLSYTHRFENYISKKSKPLTDMSYLNSCLFYCFCNNSTYSNPASCTIQSMFNTNTFLSFPSFFFPIFTVLLSKPQE